MPTKRLKQSLQRFSEAFMGRSWRETSRFLKTKDITPAQFTVVMGLRYHQCMRISEVAEAHGLSAAYASQLVDKLVHVGYVMRNEDPHDRRVNRIELTPLGQKLVEEAIEIRSGWVAQLTETISAEEATQLAEAVDKLTESIKTLDPEMVENLNRAWKRDEAP